MGSSKVERQSVEATDIDGEALMAFSGKAKLRRTDSTRLPRPRFPTSRILKEAVHGALQPGRARMDGVPFGLLQELGAVHTHTHVVWKAFERRLKGAGRERIKILAGSDLVLLRKPRRRPALG